MSYTFLHVERAALAGSLRITPAVAGFLALAVLEELGDAARRVLPEELAIDALGGVQLNGPVCDPQQAFVSARQMHARLLGATRADAAVRSRFDSGGARSVQELTRIVEAALIPINRSAARRELQRMYRRLDGVDWDEVAALPGRAPGRRIPSVSVASLDAAQTNPQHPPAPGLTSEYAERMPSLEQQARFEPLTPPRAGESAQGGAKLAADWQLRNAPESLGCSDLLSHAIGFQERSQVHSLPSESDQGNAPRDALREVRRSDVDELVDKFNVEGAQSESALSRAIQRSVGIDGTPAPAVVSVEDTGERSKSLAVGRRWPPRVATAVAGLAAVLIWQAPAPERGTTERGPSCNAALELQIPAGARATLRTGTRLITGVAPVVHTSDLNCFQPVTVQIQLADGKQELHEVSAAELQAAQHTRSPFVVRVTR